MGGSNTQKEHDNYIDKYANAIDELFSNTFAKYGETIGIRPVFVIVFSLIVTALLSIGFRDMVTENRGDKLWVPQDTRASDDRKLYESFFEPSRMEYIIVEPRDGQSMLTKSNLLEFMSLYETIANISVRVDGDEEDFYSLCVKDNSNGDPCLITSVLKNWQYSYATLSAEPDDDSVLSTINADNTVDDLKNQLGDIGTSTGENGTVITSAASAVIYFYIESNREVVNGDYVDAKAMAWERKFLDITLQSSSFPAFKVYPYAQRSLGDEFGEAIQSDISLLIISYLLLLVYVGLNLGTCDRTCVSSRIVLSITVLATVALAIVSSTGLASACGLIYTPLHGLLPFVLLGIGVDDSFVITDSFDDYTPKNRQQGNQEEQKQPQKNIISIVTSQISFALSHAGVSISITSITDLVAFAISSVSSLPALSSFCAYASLGVVFLFLMQITFFSAALTLDGRRQRDGRRDVLCCLRTHTSSNPPSPGTGSNQAVSPQTGTDIELAGRPTVLGTNDEDKDEERKSSDDSKSEVRSVGKTSAEQPHVKFVHRILGEIYAPFLLKPVVKVCVILFFLGFIVFGIIGATNLSVESSERSFIPDDSYILDTLDRFDKYFGDNGISVNIVTHSYDHFARQDILGDMQSTLDGYENKPPYLQDPYSAAYDSWYTSYISWLPSANTSVSVDEKGRPVNEDEFYESLHEFLVNPAGVRYNSSVIRSSDGNGIIASKIKTEYVPFRTYSQGRLQVDANKAVRAMDGLRDICDDLSEPVFPWTYSYIQFESLKIIKQELYQGVGLSMMAVVVVICVLIGSPTTALLVAFCVLSTLNGILGVMYYWDLVIDGVSVINIILAVGLAVDYSAHVGHAFMLTEGSINYQYACVFSIKRQLVTYVYFYIESGNFFMCCLRRNTR